LANTYDLNYKGAIGRRIEVQCQPRHKNAMHYLKIKAKKKKVWGHGSRGRVPV
jgi:hypothetical protein